MSRKKKSGSKGLILAFFSVTRAVIVLGGICTFFFAESENKKKIVERKSKKIIQLYKVV